MNVADELRRVLQEIPVLPRRVRLETPGVLATVPMLRGVWGAALHEMDAEAYRTVFAPQVEGPGEAASLYVLRPAPPDPAFAPAVEWISLGAALALDRVLWRAWDIASGMGVGSQRRRFHLRSALELGPDGRPLCTAHAPREAVLECGDLSPLLPSGVVPDTRGWPLGAAVWPLEEPAETPCRLIFPAPLRLRRHGRLIERPTLPDLVVAAVRRVGAFLPAECQAAWQGLGREAVELARSMPAGAWQGTRLDLHRYSARQESELDLHGVAGSLDLPCGPGELWPLLAAAQWLHLGKSTVMGLGQLIVEAQNDEPA
jgi:hypothetical protein